jgi:hypothetical protein
MKTLMATTFALLGVGSLNRIVETLSLNLVTFPVLQQLKD